MLGLVTAVKSINNLRNRKLINVLKPECETDSKNRGGCLPGKLTLLHFPSKENRDVKQKVGLVYCDLCGPMSTPSLGDARYFLVVIDDATRFNYVAFLRKKSDALTELKNFVNMMSTQDNGQVWTHSTDNGTE